MKTIIINSTNYVAGSGNEFVYTFPSSVKFADGDQVGLQSIAIYNSTFNVSSSLGNNTITLAWNAATPTSYTFTIPDGYYSVSDLNFFLQQKMIENKLFVTNSSSQYVYFAEMVVNSPRYAVSVNLYPIPTSSEATTLGYTQPSSPGWSYPATAACPQLTFNAAFGSLIGLEAGSYPSTTAVTTTQQFLSTKTPKLNVVDSYILTCSLIHNNYSIPANAFFQVPLTKGLGELISIQNEIVFNDIASNTYKEIRIKFFDQLFNSLELYDTQMTLSLVIKSRDE